MEVLNFRFRKLHHLIFLYICIHTISPCCSCSAQYNYPYAIVHVVLHTHDVQSDGVESLSLYWPPCPCDLLRQLDRPPVNLKYEFYVHVAFSRRVLVKSFKHVCIKC